MSMARPVVRSDREEPCPKTLPVLTDGEGACVQNSGALTDGEGTCVQKQWSFNRRRRSPCPKQVRFHERKVRVVTIILRFHERKVRVVTIILRFHERKVRVVTIILRFSAWKNARVRDRHVYAGCSTPTILVTVRFHPVENRACPGQGVFNSGKLGLSLTQPPSLGGRIGRVLDRGSRAVRKR